MAELREFVDILRAAGEITRLRLLSLLSEGELSVKDLTEILDQSQPRVSRHLRLLTESGWLLAMRRALGRSFDYLMKPMQRHLFNIY